MQDQEILESIYLLKPADWTRSNALPAYMRSDIAIEVHKAFLQRTWFEHFTISNLSMLEINIENSLKCWPDGLTGKILRYELATIIAQNKPTYRRLVRAKHLIDSVLVEDLGLFPDLKSAALEIKGIVYDMLNEPQSLSRIMQVNWSIFNRCPVVCKGCYNTFNKQILTLPEAKKIIDKLVKAGVQELILSGGDPLLWPDIVPFINYVYVSGLKIAIDTVGYHMSEELSMQLTGKLHYIGLPLDGSTQSIMESFRLGKSDLLNKIKQTINILNKLKIPIKINTVISKQNIHDLGNIACLIQSLIKNKQLWGWSIFQWWELRANQGLQDSMALPEIVFKTAVEQVKMQYPNIPIQEGSVHERARTHFFISSNGEVYTFGPSSMIGTIIIGNIKHQSIAQIIASPALKKTSPKFQSWFS